MDGKDRIILEKITKYSHEAITYTQEIDFGEFAQDSKTMSATAFLPGQIGG